jgi:hypothetical protein
VELADNKSLRNISSLIYSSNTLKKLDICNTLAIEDVYDKEFTLTDGKYTYDSYIYYGSYIYYYYHSILEEMYSAYQKANPSSEMPYYYLYIFSDGSHSNDQKHDFTTIEENITSSDSTTSTETITKVKPSCYIPYTYDDNNSTDVMTQVCKEYAYRFDNIIEMTDVILLQYKFIAANGEPSASISYSIENITDAEGNKITTGGSDGPTFKTDDGKEIGYFYVFTNSKPANFEDYAIYLDLTTNNYRLYRGYSFTNNKYSFTNYAVNWVICLKMTITVAGKSFSRYFYITVLPETDTTTNTVGSSTDTTNNTTN